MDEDDSANVVQNTIIQDTIDNLEHSLIIADISVLLLAGLLSYWLAGRTLKPIQVALDAQERFSANASHELRTPLSVMRTENEVFLKDSASMATETKDLVRSNLEEISRMTSMVENLLVLARSKKTRISTEEIKVNLTKVMKEVIHKVAVRAQQKNLILNFEGVDANIMGNEKLIDQLFYNLVQNAINYTDKGKIAIKIMVADSVIIEIQDTGIGISNDDLEHIFEPFYKADESRSNSGGVGLGLSIVEEIVKQHQGQILIESEIGIGTKVTVTFPTSKIRSL